MCFLQIDNGDAVAVVVDVGLGLWIPAAKLVAEVNACVKEVFRCGIHGVFKARKTTPGETMFLLYVCRFMGRNAPLSLPLVNRKAEMDSNRVHQGKRKGGKSAVLGGYLIKRTSTTTGAAGIWIPDIETFAAQAVVKVDHAAVQILQARRVDQE